MTSLSVGQYVTVLDGPTTPTGELREFLVADVRGSLVYLARPFQLRDGGLGPRLLLAPKSKCVPV